MSSPKLSMYLTLPSSANAVEFPENKLSEFKVKLQERLNLQDGRYEVALVDFIYSCNWKNIDDGEIVVICDKGKDNEKTFSVDILSGNVLTVKALLERIHRTAESVGLQKAFAFHHDGYTTKTYLIIRGSNVSVKLPTRLSYMLGFNPNTTFQQGYHEPETITDLRYGLRMMYIYSDLVRALPVGDTVAPLLKVEPVSFSSNNDVRINILDRQYVEVENKDTDTVSIKVTNDLGQNMPFQSGRVSAILHIRQI